MTVAGAGYSMAAVQIEILIAVGRIDPNAFAALGDDGHLLVSRQLKLIFAGDNIAVGSFHCAHPARAPSGTRCSGTARQGVMPSTKPMSNNIPSESWPIIFRGGKLTTKSACLPSIS